MRVMCISLKNFTGRPGFGKAPMEIGDVFNVVDEVIGYTKDGLAVECYVLEPWAHTDQAHDKRNFAILPDTPAEVIEEKETVEA